MLATIKAIPDTDNALKSDNRQTKINGHLKNIYKHCLFIHTTDSKFSCFIYSSIARKRKTPPSKLIFLWRIWNLLVIWTFIEISKFW